MVKTVLALQHSSRFARNIREGKHFELYHDADQLIARVDAAAEELIAVHEELKELRANQPIVTDDDLKCWASCPRQNCKDFFSCPAHWGDLNEVTT